MSLHEISPACEFMNTYRRSLVNYEPQSEKMNVKKGSGVGNGVLQRMGIFHCQMEANSVANASRYHLGFELPCAAVFLCKLIIYVCALRVS